MLLYDNRSFLRLVLCKYGSIILRVESMVMGCLIAGMAGLCQYLIENDSAYAPQLPHHYAMHALGTTVGFAVVFRTNLGWNRYWEAVGQLHLMYSKWCDAFSQLVAFASVTTERAYASDTQANIEKAVRVEEIVEHAFNCFTVMSAFAADRLTHGDTSRMERRCETGASWSQRIVKREALRQTVDGETMMPQFEVSSSKLKEQTPSGRDVGVGDIQQNAWQATYRVRALPSEDEMRALEDSTDRTTVVMYWIIFDLAKVSNELEAAPPIQSRMYQELSNGMLGFNQCSKLADVPFPFPYAQMLTWLLCCFAAFIPVYVTVFSKSWYVSIILSFCLFEGIWGLNETAKELENPFGIDDNDINLQDFHFRFLDCCDEVFESCTLRGPPSNYRENAEIPPTKEEKDNNR
jgi:predicted membrane chloride channel (bestrophin family)